MELEEVNFEEEQPEAAEPEEKGERQEEFDFPLFSLGTISLASGKEAGNVEEATERGRSSTAVMKVSLREESEERVVNERPNNYYFAQYNETQKQQFAEVCVTGDEIYKQMEIYTGPSRGVLLDLTVYNSEIVEDSKKKRPGKNQRKNRIESRIRKAERARKEAEIEKQKMARMMKKKFHKRGGKKNKKKGVKLQ